MADCAVDHGRLSGYHQLNHYGLHSTSAPCIRAISRLGKSNDFQMRASAKMTRSSIMRAAAGALVLVSMGASFAVSPALAQSDCTCFLPAGAGQVGSISSANPDVFVAGSTGQQAAAAGTPLTSGSVVTTGPNGTAAINLGSGCQFSMAGSMSMQIVPQSGGLCVRVVDDSVPDSGIDGGTVAAAGLAAGAGVVVSLGMLLSVSQ